MPRQEAVVQAATIDFLPLPAVMTDFKVELVEDNISEMHVEFRGPKDSAWLGWILLLTASSYSPQ